MAFTKWVGFALVACLGGAALATPGGVDKDGCHNSQKTGFHCHPKKIEKIQGYRHGELDFERGKRLSYQCRGLPNEGVCKGYTYAN